MQGQIQRFSDPMRGGDEQVHVEQFLADRLQQTFIQSTSGDVGENRANDFLSAASVTHDLDAVYVERGYHEHRLRLLCKLWTGGRNVSDFW